MNERGRLESELRHMLHEKAGSVVVDDRDFDPGGATETSDAMVTMLAITPRKHRTRRVRARVLVAAVLVGALAVAAVVARVTSSPGRAVHVIEPPATVPGLAPGQVVQVDSPVVAPTWVPAGEQLWSFDTQRTTTGIGGVSQLVGLPVRGGNVQAAIFITFQPAPADPPPPPGSTAPPIPPDLQDHRPRITVRGVRGIVEPAKDGGLTMISWTERGTYVNATVRGMWTLQARDLLNRLRPAGRVLSTSGYAAASVPAP